MSTTPTDELDSIRSIFTGAAAATPSDATLSQLRSGINHLFSDNLPLPKGVRFSTVEGPVAGTFGDSDGADARRVVLHCHGGGYALGSVSAWRALSGELGRRFGMRSFAVEYALAPENPFPSAPDHILAAYRWLLDEGFEPKNIIVSGDSAGCALALGLLVQARDAGIPQPAAAYLMSPWVDLTLRCTSLTLKADVEKVISVPAMEMLAGLYLGDRSREDPLASPLFADLTGLSPVLVQCGSHEILLDDAVNLTRALALADVHVQCEVWPGAFHEFQFWHSRLAMARDALDSAATFVSRVLSGQLAPPA